MTLYAVWETDPTAPDVSIRNYVASRTERFYTTVEFFADAKNIPKDAQTVWYVNGEEKCVGEDHYAFFGAKRDYTVQVKIMRAGEEIVASKVETVRISRNFSNLLSGFFRILIHKPYNVKQ